jgi:hypothetical protein
MAMDLPRISIFVLKMDTNKIEHGNRVWGMQITELSILPSRRASALSLADGMALLLLLPAVARHGNRTLYGASPGLGGALCRSAQQCLGGWRGAFSAPAARVERADTPSGSPKDSTARRTPPRAPRLHYRGPCVVKHRRVLTTESASTGVDAGRTTVR